MDHRVWFIALPYVESRRGVIGAIRTDRSVELVGNWSLAVEQPS